LPTESNNQPGAAQPGQPAAGEQPAPAPAEEQAQTSGWKAAEQFKAERDAIRAERDALKAEKAKQAEAKLAEDGEWQKLADQRLKALEAANAEIQAMHLHGEVRDVASSLGANDWRDILPHVSEKLKAAGVSLSDRGAVSSMVKSYVPELSKEKSYLFPKNGKTGTPYNTPQANPGGSSPELLDLKKLTTRQQHEEARKKDPQAYLAAMRRMSESS